MITPYAVGQFIRLEKEAYARWWAQEQILRAWDREMMMREEALCWALVVQQHVLDLEARTNREMEREDAFSRQVWPACPRGDASDATDGEGSMTGMGWR
jgi:hypothetical protein